jgi:Niemann-Pick C1 protein
LQVVLISGPYFKYFESYRIILKEMILNLVLALVGVAVIGAMFLVHPGAVALMLVCVVAVDLMLIGEMWLLGIEANTVSAVNLVMAVGLAVDYSLHIIHGFLGTRGATRSARAQIAVREIGAAVIVAFASTLLGVLVLSGTVSEILRIFFQLLLGTVVFGAVAGMLFMPVLLSLVGPAPCLYKPQEPISDALDGPPEDGPPECTVGTYELMEDGRAPAAHVKESGEAASVSPHKE